MNTEKIMRTCLTDTRIAELKATLKAAEGLKAPRASDIVELIERRIEIYEQIKVMSDE